MTPYEQFVARNGGGPAFRQLEAKTYFVVSYYHSGTVKRRERYSLNSAHNLAAAEVDVHGAHTAEIIGVGIYQWEGGLTYHEVE